MNENDVFRFDVTMQYLVLVHQIDSIKKVTDDEGSRLLRKCGSIWYDVKQLAVRA